MLREKSLYIILTVIILLTLAVLSWMLVNSSLFGPELPPGAKKVFNKYKLEEGNLNSDCQFRLKLSVR